MAKKSTDETAPEEVPETAIQDTDEYRTKIAAGLTPEQAVEVIANQLAHDKSLGL